jgi:hypothetical protein
MHTFDGNVGSLERVLLVKKPPENGIYKLWVELRHILARYNR